MTDDKPLGIQHAKITGQVMRDHWGPIIDRIADEIADPRDAFINELISEIERLRVEVKAQYDRGYYDGCTRAALEARGLEIRSKNDASDCL